MRGWGLGPGAAALAMACAGGGEAAPALSAVAASERPVAAVPVDPEFSLPRPGVTATSAGGLAVLVAPADPGPVRATVAAFFDAVTTESAPGLERVVDAAARSRTSNKARPDPALSWWRRRFDALDYTALATEVFFFPSAMEIRTAREVSGGAGARGLPVLPRNEEILVRVPIVGQNASKLMGNEIVFLLKPRPAQRGAYTIAELYEDFRLP